MATRFGAAIPGLSRLAQSLMGGQNAYQGGYDNELGLQSKLAQALAAARASDANAEESLAKAGNERLQTRVLQQRPDLVLESIAASAATDIPMVRAIKEQLATGRAPQVPMGPPTDEGEMGQGSQQFDPQTRSAVLAELQRMLPVLTGVKDINPEQYAKARGAYREMDLGDQVLAGQRTPGAVGASQAALAGKPLFNSDANGAVLDLFGGGYETANPMAQSTIGLKREQGLAQKANAAQSYASADSSRASAAKTRADMAEGGGSKGTYDAARGVVVDPRTGTYRPVVGVDGQPLAATPRAGPMSVTLQKELIESDDTVQSAANVVRSLETALRQNKEAYSGYFAKPRAMLRSNLPGQSASADATIDIDNLMTGQGLESLKSIFGAAPTEGERKILMDMQASVDKTPAQRKEIMDRAISAAKRRAIYAGKKAQAIRSGKYLNEGVGAVDVPAAPASDGWAVEQVR